MKTKSLSAQNYLRQFFVAFAITIVWFAIMRQLTPPNIVQFELAGDIRTAENIISRWNPELITKIKTGIYLDFGFILCYCTVFIMTWIFISDFSGVKFFTKINKQFILFISIAGVCDIIENIAMLKTLNVITQTTVSIAFYAATVKFGILLLALIFILMCVVTGLFTRKPTT